MKTRREELLETAASLMAAEIIGYKYKYSGYCDYNELTTNAIVAAQILLDKIDDLEPRAKKRVPKLGPKRY